MGIDNSFVCRDSAEVGEKVCSSYTLEDDARECGKALEDELVSADLYLENEALIAFIGRETGLTQVRDLAAAIHDKLTRLGTKLSGLSEVLYSSNDPVATITARLQSKIARLTEEKKRRDAISESDAEDEGESGHGGGHQRGNGRSFDGGDEIGKSERLIPGTVVDGVVVKLFSGGFKVTIPGGGKSVAVHCNRTGGFRAGQTVTVRMTGAIDDFKNPVAELVSGS